MTHFEFYGLVYNNLLLYIFSLLICSLFFYFIGKRCTHTWFDPLRIALIAYTFSLTVLVFLYLTKEINFDIFIYFLLAEVIFWLAFIIPVQKEKLFSNKKLVNERKIAFILFLIFLLLYVLFTGITYIQLGIPLLMKSRLDTYAGSGLGFLGRMIPFFRMYCIIYSFYLWKNSNKYSFEKNLILVTLFIFGVTGVLSGSRSTFFYFVYSYWGYCYFYRRNLTEIPKYYRIFVIGIIVTIISFILTTNSNNIISGTSHFFLRAISSGDHYYMALPNNTLNHVKIGSWFNHFFYGLLGPLRLIAEENTSPAIGYQLTWLVNPTLKGLHVGPLSSPSILGYCYFGWGGLLFSFIIGFLVSLCCFRLPVLLPKGIISSILSIYIYIQLLAFITDPCMAMGFLFDLLLNIAFFVCLILIIYIFSRDPQST